MVITPLSAPPGAPDTVNAASKLRVHSKNYLRVLLIAAGATVSVRPWFWYADKWWPLRYDGAGVGIAPVTGVPANLGGKAEGLFHTVGLSTWVILMIETGLVGSVSEAHLEIADAEV